MKAKMSRKVQSAKAVRKSRKIAVKETQTTTEEMDMSSAHSRMPETEEIVSDIQAIGSIGTPDESGEDSAENSGESTAEKKPHLSTSKKIKLLREHVTAGKSQEEICEIMNITTSQFKTLYFYLVHQDRIFYDVPHKAPVRRCKIGENGFAVSMEKIHAIGLASEFPLGWELSFTRDGRKMIIEAFEATQTEDDADDILEDEEENSNTNTADTFDRQLREMFPNEYGNPDIEAGE